MVCSCGGTCTSSEVKIAGVIAHAYTCRACGRREVFLPSRTHDQDELGLVTDFSARQESPPQAQLTQKAESHPIEMQETLDLFDRTVKNLLTMPPMPRKRRKP